MKKALQILKDYRRAYITLNIVFYGLVVLGMIYVAFNPGLQTFLLESTVESFSEGPMASVMDAYLNSQAWVATALTFVVNLLGGSIASLTVPSLIIPFIGIVLGGFRAVLWGLLMSPANADMRLAMIPHALTLILEGQAYIIAMLAVYIQGRAFLKPKTVQAATRGQGYKIGLKLTLRLYVLIIILLLIAALYEVLEVIYIVPHLI